MRGVHHQSRLGRLELAQGEPVVRTCLLIRGRDYVLTSKVERDCRMLPSEPVSALKSLDSSGSLDLRGSSWQLPEERVLNKIGKKQESSQ